MGLKPPAIVNPLPTLRFDKSSVPSPVFSTWNVRLTGDELHRRIQFRHHFPHAGKYALEPESELLGRFRWVQIFETRGAMSGASNPHPHGQIWSSSFLPNEAVRELESQRKYLASHGSPMLYDYVEREVEAGERIVLSNDTWAVT